MSTIFKDIDIKNWEKNSLNNVLGICGFFPAYVNYLFVRDKNKVLIIGDYKGRDYNFLKRFGKDITVFDINLQSNIEIEDQVIGDANNDLPFESKCFDAVVVFDVIEHLLNDGNFLLEVRRILKEDGTLSFAAPFLNDYADFHLRIHSDSTVKRLLGVSGFRITDFVYRGAFLYLNNLLGFVDGAFIKLISLFSKKDAVVLRLRVNEFITNKILVPIGKRKVGKFLSRYIKGYYGCFVRAIKGEFLNINEINISKFKG